MNMHFLSYCISSPCHRDSQRVPIHALLLYIHSFASIVALTTLQVASRFGSTATFADVLLAWTSHAVTAGHAPPHFVIQDGYNDTFTRDLRLHGAVQSRSSYALGDGLINGTFSQQIDECVHKWEAWAANGDDVIPLAATGWDPRDRASGCASWMPHGEGKAWTQSPTPSQVVEVIETAVQWVCNRTVSDASTQHVLVYAWNENSEGGWLVPTLGEGTARIDALAEHVSGQGWSCSHADRHRMQHE